MAICLLGSTGAGKSSLANVFIGDRSFTSFAVGGTMLSQTTESKVIQNILDTPGFNDSRNSTVVEAKIYDNIIKSILKSKIKCLVFVLEKASRLKGSDQENMKLFLKFPDSIPRVIVMTKVGLQDNRNDLQLNFKNALKEVDFITLEGVPFYMVDCSLYRTDDPLYPVLKNMPPFSDNHRLNETAFTELIRFSTGCSVVECNADLLKMIDENPFKIKIETEIDNQLSDILQRKQTTFVAGITDYNRSALENLVTDEDYKNTLEQKKSLLFEEVGETFRNNVKAEYLEFLPLESISIYISFCQERVNWLNEKLLNYIKVRQFKVLDKMVLEVINEISKESLRIYETSNNPFLTIEEINKIWDKKQIELSNNTSVSDEEAIEVFNRTKEYIEEELNGFRKIIFGNSYNMSIKARVLEWSSDTRHLATDGYKELHNLIIVKCPGCQYPWGNHGACPNRTCLFCLTTFKWNKAEVVKREDWDRYDYSPAYVPQVGVKNVKYKTSGTVIGPNLK